MVVTSQEAKKSELVFTLITLLSFIFVFGIILNLRYFNGNNEWRWAYSPEKIRLSIFELFIIFLFPLLFLLTVREHLTQLRKRRKGFFEIKFLFFYICLGFLFQLMLQRTNSLGLEKLFISTYHVNCNGYYVVSKEINDLNDLKNLLTHYYQMMDVLPGHCNTHPPGIIIYYFIINAISKNIYFLLSSIGLLKFLISTFYFQSPDSTSLIFSTLSIPFFSLTSILPIYYFAKQNYNLKTAVYSSALFPFVPSLTFAVSQPDQLYCLLFMSALFLFSTGIRKNKTFPIILSGLITFLGIFSSFGLLIIIPFLILYAILSYLKYNNKKINIIHIILFLISIFFFFLLLSIITKMNFIKIFTKATRFHTEATLIKRSYWLWTYWNLLDFFIFAGIPLSFLFFLRVIEDMKSKQILNPKSFDPLMISFLIIIFLLTFSGKVRGETSRLWLFFTPILTILASVKFSQLRYRKNFYFGLVLILLFLITFACQREIDFNNIGFYILEDLPMFR